MICLSQPTLENKKGKSLLEPDAGTQHTVPVAFLYLLCGIKSVCVKTASNSLKPSRSLSGAHPLSAGGGGGGWASWVLFLLSLLLASSRSRISTTAPFTHLLSHSSPTSYAQDKQDGAGRLKTSGGLLVRGGRWVIFKITSTLDMTLLPRIPQTRLFPGLGPGTAMVHRVLLHL